MFDLREVFESSWQEVYTKIIGAAVFIDNNCAECLHWDGGISSLYNAGVTAVKSLSPFESAGKEHKKGVFITKALGNNLETVREIIKSSNFSHCILIACTSPEILYHELNEEKDLTEAIVSGRATNEVTKQVECLLAEWMNKKPCLAELTFVPLFIVPFTNVIFVTPPYANLYPTFNGSLQIDQTTVADMYSLSSDDRTQVRRLTASFNCLFNIMDVKEDIYFLGTFSSVVAGSLEHMPAAANRRKNATKQISLIFVDRTLDLCNSVAHNSDSMWDKLSSALPRFPDHSTDLAVDMSPICAASGSSSPKDIHLCPGCLYQPQNEQCAHTLDHMVNKTQKEVLLDLDNRLSKLDVPRSPSNKLLQKVTALLLEKQILPAKGNYNIIDAHSGLLQQALAVVQTLKSPKIAEIDLMVSLEKQILLNVTTSKDSTSILLQISSIIKTRKQRELSLETILSLLVFTYSIAGCEVSFPPDHESALVDVLSIALFEDHKKVFSTFEDTTKSVGPEECNQVAKEILHRLKQLAGLRKGMVRYKSILQANDVGFPLEYKGLTEQLIDNLVDINKADIPDLKCRSDGLKDLIRSSLSLFRNPSGKKSRNAKHPLDNPLVIVFIIGGTTADECKRLHRSVITSGTDTQVLFGSTRLVNPLEATRQVLNL